MKKLLLFLFATPLFGATLLDNVIDDFVSGLHSEIKLISNHTNPDAFYDSSLGFSANLGGGMLRNNVRSIRPVNIQLPHLDIGCGGIDYSFGSINVIGTKEWGKMFVDIGKALGTHFLVLSLQAAAPQTLDSLYKIQSFQMILNGADINTCKIGQSIAESIFPAGTAASESICQNIGTKTGLFKSRISALHGCATRNKEAQTIFDSNAMEWIHGDYNLAYEAMKGLGVHEEEFDIYLNISGTIIRRENCVTSQKTKAQQCDSKYTFYKPKIEEALHLFLHGTPALPSIEEQEGDSAYKGEFYKFSRENGTIPEKGLNLTQTATLPRSPFIGGRINKIQEILSNILEKINKERSSPQTLNFEESHFLGSSSFPIEALLNLMGQNQGRTVSHHFSLYDFAKLLAIEEVATYIGVIGNRMLQAFQKLKFKIGFAKEIDELSKGLEGSLTFLNGEKQKVYDRLNAKYNLIKVLLEIEQTSRKKFGGEP